VNPTEFLSLANTLVSSQSTPPQLRTATSRAYYAAHHVGKDLLIKAGLRISTGGTGHSDVHYRLQNSGDTDVIVAGQKLSELQSSRNDADYKLNKQSAETIANVKLHLLNAASIIETIERAFSSNRRESIITAMKNWERITGMVR